VKPSHQELQVALEEAANLDELEVGETLLVELSEPVCLVRLASIHR
jgi:hypothetical protein